MDFLLILLQIAVVLFQTDSDLMALLRQRYKHHTQSVSSKNQFKIVVRLMISIIRVRSCVTANSLEPKTSLEYNVR